jgi:uncharacterized integral membrane protein
MVSVSMIVVVLLSVIIGILLLCSYDVFKIRKHLSGDE